MCAVFILKFLRFATAENAIKELLREADMTLKNNSSDAGSEIIHQDGSIRTRDQVPNGEQALPALVFTPLSEAERLSAEIELNARRKSLNDRCERLKRSRDVLFEDLDRIIVSSII